MRILSEMVNLPFFAMSLACQYYKEKIERVYAESYR